MADPVRIPLFPLDLVLFPGMALPLHIFEPRYKLMIRRCLDEKVEFGVVLARSEGIAPVGCTAEILKVIKRYPDGRLDILTAGRRLYRVLAVFEGQPYLEASVEYRHDAPGSAGTALRKMLAALFEQCHELLYGRTPSPPDPEAPAPFSYQIAGELPLDLEFKQELIETESEEERERTLLERMQAWVPQLTQMDRVRRKGSGNGHGLN